MSNIGGQVFRLCRGGVCWVCAAPVPLAALLASCLTLFALLATSPALPMAWDEGNAIDRAASIEQWLAMAVHPRSTALAFQPAVIAAHWPFTTQREGHPAFYGLLIALGHTVSGGFLGPLEAYRLGPMLLFAVAVGACFARVRRLFGWPAAWGAVTALVLLPRLFAHAHFASFDGPLTACWLLAWCAFPDSPERRRRWALWGICLGMTFACKATGWLAVLPFVIWAMVVYRRRAWQGLAIGGAVALAVFFVLNPPLWHAPVAGLLRFLWLNTHRHELAGLNIATLFLGRMYNLEHPLPPYNTLLWTALALPLGTLLLFLLGLAMAWRGENRSASLLVVLNWAMLVIVRALPGVPVHDGIRLFLPSVAFAAILAGLGFAALWRWGHPDHSLLRRCGLRTLGVCLLGSAAVPMLCYAPQWLAHYSVLIGGLPGATRAGMEPTYYWDSLDRATIHWLNANTEEGEVVCFAAAPPRNLAYLHAWGHLEVETSLQPLPGCRWYVIQHRPSGWSRLDARLFSEGQPSYEMRLRGSCAEYLGLSRVPLLRVFSMDQYRRIAEREAGTAD